MLQSPINYERWIIPLGPSRGQEIVVSCPLEGNPPASYQWYFKHLLNDDTLSKRIPIYPDNNLNVTFLNNNRTLFFRSFEEVHNGYYSCSAENIFRNAMYEGFPPLEVHSKSILFI